MMQPPQSIELWQQPKPALLLQPDDKVLLLRHGTTDLLAIAQRRGADLHKLLAGTRIFEQDLHKPLARLSHQEWCRLLLNCQQQIASPELPFLLGVATLQNEYIALCQSLRTAPNLSHALRQLCQFRHQLTPAFFPVIYREQQHIILELKPAVSMDLPSGKSDSLEQFMVSMLMALLVELVREQVGRTEGLTVQLRHRPRMTSPSMGTLLGCAVHVAQPSNSLRIELGLWQQPFRSFDARQFENTRRTCRQLNAVLPVKRGLLEQVYRLQRRALPQHLSLEQVAWDLGLTTSSLRRQLSQQHTSFAKIADEVRQDTARRLLQQGSLSNRQLASRLGYSDEHNFRRAFKRWTGNIPSNFRSLFE